MSKYTPEELKEMALFFVRAQNDGIDQRWLHLVVTVATMTGLEPDQVIERIREFARYEA